MWFANVHPAEGRGDSYIPPPEPYAQRVRIVMSTWSAIYACEADGSFSRILTGIDSIFCRMERYPTPHVQICGVGQRLLFLILIFN